MRDHMYMHMDMCMCIDGCRVRAALSARVVRGELNGRHRRGVDDSRHEFAHVAAPLPVARVRLLRAEDGEEAAIQGKWAGEKK